MSDEVALVLGGMVILGMTGLGALALLQGTPFRLWVRVRDLFLGFRTVGDRKPPAEGG